MAMRMAGSGWLRGQLDLLRRPIREISNDEIDALERVAYNLEEKESIPLFEQAKILELAQTPYGRLGLLATPRPVPLSHVVVPSDVVDGRIDEFVRNPPERAVSIDLSWMPEEEGTAYSSLVNGIVPMPDHRGEVLSEGIGEMISRLGLREGDIVTTPSRDRNQNELKSAVALAKRGFGPVSEWQQMARVGARGTLVPELINPADSGYARFLLQA